MFPWWLGVILCLGNAVAVWTFRKLSLAASHAQNALEWEKQAHDKTKARLLETFYAKEQAEHELEVRKRASAYRD